MVFAIYAKTLVIGSDGKALVLRRSATDEDNPGHPDFPGGGVDAGESYVAAAVRELYEEAGLGADEADMQLVYAFTQYEPKKEAIIFRLLYTVRVDSADVQLSHEHDDYWWQPLDGLQKVFAGRSWEPAISFALKHGLAS
ncbi:MAG TPA: NUDIX hydrolase [Candidatus Saccharimonadales bacterium]|nr:NUDIX hydrolase [Candidatus Saccharimonadales bacterium]